MKKNKETQVFHFVTVTAEDIKKETAKHISELTEDKKSEFVFNTEPLYILGRGHSFGNGFFAEYITKTGITAWCFDSGIWKIDNDTYYYVNSEFIKRVEPILNTEPVDFSNLQFPIIKNRNAKCLSSDLLSVKPKN